MGTGLIENVNSIKNIMNYQKNIFFCENDFLFFTKISNMSCFENVP